MPNEQTYNKPKAPIGILKNSHARTPKHGTKKSPGWKQAHAYYTNLKHSKIILIQAEPITCHFSCSNKILKGTISLGLG